MYRIPSVFENTDILLPRSSVVQIIVTTYGDGVVMVNFWTTLTPERATITLELSQWEWFKCRFRNFFFIL